MMSPWPPPPASLLRWSATPQVGLGSSVCAVCCGWLLRWQVQPAAPPPSLVSYSTGGGAVGLGSSGAALGSIVCIRLLGKLTLVLPHPAPPLITLLVAAALTRSDPFNPRLHPGADPDQVLVLNDGTLQKAGPPHTLARHSV